MTTVPVYVGLDDHDQTIRVCVLAEDGKVLFNCDVDNDVRAVAREVRRCRSPQGVLIEACSGAAGPTPLRDIWESLRSV